MYSEAYIKSIEFFSLKGYKNFKDAPDQILIEKFGNWTIAMHNRADIVTIRPDNCMSYPVPGRHIVVWFNGWYASTISLFTGLFLSGESVNEQKYLDDLSLATNDIKEK
ncbi:MAG: hypothetical protein KKH44_07780 [Bacteroidetes bacterium]|nr:hypothetical protein [Bacteroidota bacterium]